MTTRRGFTLVETVVALTILAIVFTSLAKFMGAFVGDVRRSEVKTVATEVANEQMQYLKSWGDYFTLANFQGTLTGFPSRGYPNMKRVTTVLRSQRTTAPILWDRTTITVKVSDPGMKDTVALTYVVGKP